MAYLYIIEYIIIQILAIVILVYTIKNHPQKDNIYSYVLFVRGVGVFMLLTGFGIFFLVKKISYTQLILGF